MKIAVVGKGGAGKTLVAATLSRLLGQGGNNVLAVDVDSNPNLGFALGLGNQMKELVPITQNKELVEERTQYEMGFFNMNPTVDDLADKFAVTGPDGVRLLIAGHVEASSKSSCMCPAHALLKAMLRHLVLREKDFLVLDAEAGLEVFSRGTLRGLDSLIIVTEPSQRSLITVERMISNAESLGLSLKDIMFVLNKIPEGMERPNLQLPDGTNLQFSTVLPLDIKVSEADAIGVSLLDYAPDSQFVRGIKQLVEKISS